MASPKASRRSNEVVTVQQLISFAARKKNVLLSGLHGIGKTEMIVQTFSQHFGTKNVDWIYLNGATIDPWLQFIGCPKSVINDNGEEVMRVIPPESMPNTIRAIFMDEINRASKEVRNALMELIQFRSINGRSFPNLEVVWSAVNPGTNSDYDVELLDPAQEDRYPVQIALPYMVNEHFFKDRFGDSLGKKACDWWNGLNQDERLLVSPRRLEEAVVGYLEGDELRFYLSDKVKHSDLANVLDAARKKNMFEEYLQGLTPDQIGVLFTFDKVLEKASFFEDNVAVFEKKVLPHLTDEVVSAIFDHNRGLQKVRTAIGKSSRKPKRHVSTIVSAKVSLDSVINEMLRGDIAPKRQAPEPFLDSLAESYPHLEEAASRDAVNFKSLVAYTGCNTKVDQAMVNWNTLTKDFRDPMEKAVYAMLFARKNRSDKAGISSVFKEIVDGLTWDFKKLISEHSHVEVKAFLLEIAVTSVLVSELRQQYKRGSFISHSSQADGFFDSGSLRQIASVVGKILRSGDLKREIAGAAVDHIDAIHAAYARSTGEKKQNRNVANAFIKHVSAFLAP